MIDHFFQTMITIKHRVPLPHKPFVTRCSILSLHHSQIHVSIKGRLKLIEVVEKLYPLWKIILTVSNNLPGLTVSNNLPGKRELAK